MKVVGIAVLLAGVFFTLYVLFIDPVTPVTTQTAGWGPWIGLLVIATGAVTVFNAREE